MKEKEKNAVPEEHPETNPKDDEEDLLYTHKPESRGSSIHWNSYLCRKPGH
ncbi:MAG: hypothetical protein WB014_04665 [Methanosarcina sp.]